MSATIHASCFYLYSGILFLPSHIYTHFVCIFTSPHCSLQVFGGSVHAGYRILNPQISDRLSAAAGNFPGTYSHEPWLLDFCNWVVQKKCYRIHRMCYSSCGYNQSVARLFIVWIQPVCCNTMCYTSYVLYIV